MQTLTFFSLSFAAAAEVALKDEGPSGAAVSWNAATPYPTDVFGYAFAQDGENMYIIAGDDNNDSPYLTDVRRYNARTNVWTTLADIPAGSIEAVATFYDGKIYVFMVAPGDGFRFYIYDVASNTWSQGPPRPVTECFGAAVGAFNGKVYVAGGGFASGGAGATTLTIYDIASNTWSTGPPAPSPNQLAGCAQIGQFLYIIGGYGSGLNNSDVSMRLDMATNSWSVGPVFNPRRAHFALAAAGTKLFAIGGESNGGGAYDAAVQVHELETSTWPAGGWFFSPDNLPSGRMAIKAGFFSTGRAGGEIWSVGGQSADIFTNNLNENLFRPVSVPCVDYYTVTESTGTLVPGTFDTANHCDDCLTNTPFQLPFAVRFYGTTYGTARASSNGNLQFMSTNVTGNNTNLPAATFNAAIFPFWDNLRTDLTGGGIFTSTTGTAPNRVFNIEWRVSNLAGTATANFELRFFEGSEDFEFIYGASSGNFSGTIGVQRDGSSLFEQIAGPTAPFPAAGTRYLFTTACCGPLAFNGVLGSNSTGYPGTSGLQTGRVSREGAASACGVLKPYPGTFNNSQRTSDRYVFTNDGPATCVTFEVSSSCAIHAVAYLGSFDPANIAANYRGDSGGNVGSFRQFSVDVPAHGTVILVINELNPGGGCPSYDVIVRGLSCPMELATAVSRKTHGGAGEMDIPLPLSAPLGVECRTRTGNDQKIVLTFASESAMTGGNALLTLGTGTVGTPTFLGKTMTIPLTGVTDHQKISLLLNAVTNSDGQFLPNTIVSMNVLLGDTSGNSNVNTSDIGQTKSNSGQQTTTANFRTDVNSNGATNTSDIGQVKANSGHTLPP